MVAELESSVVQADERDRREAQEKRPWRRVTGGQSHERIRRAGRDVDVEDRFVAVRNACMHQVAHGRLGDLAADLCDHAHHPVPERRGIGRPRRVRVHEGAQLAVEDTLGEAGAASVEVQLGAVADAAEQRPDPDLPRLEGRHVSVLQTQSARSFEHQRPGHSSQPPSDLAPQTKREPRPLRCWPLEAGSPGGVLRLIRDGRAVTRTEVMGVTGLSRSTVMQRLGVLLSAGLLLEEPEAGRSSGGRRPAALSFNQRMGVVLAADLGARHGRLAVCDLAGATLAELAEPIRIADGPEPVLDWVGRTFEALLAEAGRDGADVLASAIGVPGPVEVATGRPMNPPLMPGWDGYGVADNLRERFGAPALLERDVHAMALGEHRRHRRELSHMVFVKVATGIGAGIISDGELLRGNHGRAGDIGHIRAIRQSDVMCTCGNRGCVAVLASAAAVIRELGEAGIEVDSTDGVVELVRAGDAVAMHHVREAGRVLGAALAAVVSVVAPTVIVVGGDLADASEPLLAGIRESVYQRASALATRELRILTSRLGPRAGVVGATTLALEHVLEPANVDALLAARGLAA